MIDIKDVSGNVLLSTEINIGARGEFSLMKEDFIILPFSLKEYIHFGIGSYVDLTGVFEDGLGGRLAKFYEVTDPYKPLYNEQTGGYDYQLRLDAYYWKWKNKIFKYTPENHSQEGGWSLTAPLNVHLNVFLRNLKALGYKYNGVDFVYSIDTTVENKAIALSYSNTNLIDGLTMMAEVLKCEWWVTENVIHFGRCEVGSPVKMEVGIEAESIKPSKSMGKYATRIYVFGGKKNIPEDYREQTTGDLVVNGIVQKRLMMPSGTPYLDANTGQSEEESIEAVVIFDDIYPRRTGTMSGVSTRIDDIENEDGTTETVKYYRYKDTGITFSKDYVIKGKSLSIKFESGKLNGMEFGVIFNPDNSDPEQQLWEIIRNDTYGRPLPDDTLSPENGDKYILAGFDTKFVSTSYLPAAEQELQERGQRYLDITKIDDGIYITKLFSNWVREDMVTRFYDVGQKVNLINPGYFADGRLSRIIGWKFNLDIPYDTPEYIIGESAQYSRLDTIESKLDSITYNGQTFVGGGQGGESSVYVIRTNDSTPPSDTNVFSALRSLSMFLRKDRPDWTQHLTGFYGGATYGTFVSGLLGSGAKIDENGHEEANSLTLREFLEVPELRFNRVDVVSGELWNSIAFGLIKDVDTVNHIVTLKLEEGELSGIHVGDICRGIFHNLTGNEHSQGQDECGFEKMVGFSTAYFTPVEIIDNEHFKYALREGSGVNPCPSMKFAVYGSFTDTSRQASAYSTRTYKRYLVNVDTWVISPNNITYQEGDLSNLTINGQPLTGGSVYLNSVYFGENINFVHGVDNPFSPYTVLLSTYSVNYKDGDPNPKTTLQIRKGATNLTIVDSIVTDSKGKCTVSIGCETSSFSFSKTTGVIEVSGVSVDVTKVNIHVNCEALASFDLQFIINRIKDGVNGDPGEDGGTTIQVFRVFGENDNVTAPSGTAVPPTGWSIDPPSSPGQIYVSIALCKRVNNNWIATGAWSTPVKFNGQKGLDGKNQPMPINRGVFKNDSSVLYEGSENRCDVVGIKEGGVVKYYKAKPTAGVFNGTHVPSSTSVYWEKFNVDVPNIASGMAFFEMANISGWCFEDQYVYSQSGNVLLNGNSDVFPKFSAGIPPGTDDIKERSKKALTRIYDDGRLYTKEGEIGNFKLVDGFFLFNGEADRHTGFISMVTPNTEITFGTDIYSAGIGTSNGSLTAYINNSNPAPDASGYPYGHTMALRLSASGGKYQESLRADNDVIVMGKFLQSNWQPFNTDATSNTVLNIGKSNQFLIWGNTKHTVFLPSASEIEEALLIESNSPYYIRINILAGRYAPQTINIFPSDNTHIINFDGNEVDHITMNKLTSRDFVLYREDGDSYAMILS